LFGKEKTRQIRELSSLFIRGCFLPTVIPNDASKVGNFGSLPGDFQGLCFVYVSYEPDTTL